jgi:hypothetical protein
VGWHFPAGGLRRSAAGGPGRRQIPLPAWRLDAVGLARVTTCGGEQLSWERPVRVRHEQPCLPTEADASAAVPRLAGHLVHAIAAGACPAAGPAPSSPARPPHRPGPGRRDSQAPASALASYDRATELERGLDIPLTGLANFLTPRAAGQAGRGSASPDDLVSLPGAGR